MLGILSLIFWAILMVVTVKYVVFVMRADNKGEGGILALLALALRSAGKSPGTRRFLMVTGLLGASLFYGDAIITPAISVTWPDLSTGGELDAARVDHRPGAGVSVV